MTPNLDAESSLQQKTQLQLDILEFVFLATWSPDTYICIEHLLLLNTILHFTRKL